jgi:hypothetical protein
MTGTAQAIATQAANTVASINIWQALWTAVGAGVVTHLVGWLKNLVTPTNEVKALQVAQGVLATSGHPQAAAAAGLVGQVIAAKNAQQPGA